MWCKRPKSWQMASVVFGCLITVACTPSHPAAGPAVAPVPVDISQRPRTPDRIIPVPSGGVLSLEQAVQRAVTWHPSINEAIARLQQQAEEINIARAGYYPSVSGGLDLGTGDALGGGEWEPALNISASQTIFDFGKTSSAVDAATAGTEVTRAQVLRAADQVILDTAYAVIEVQRNQALKQIALDHVAGVEAIADLVRQRTNTGAGTRSDILQAELRIRGAEATVFEVEANLPRWQSKLAYLMGNQGPVAVSADVPGWLAGTCNAGEPIWSDVPAIMQARAQLDEAQAQSDAARADIFPTLSLDVGTDIGLRDFGHTDPDIYVGLGFSGKIFDGGAAGARSSAAGYAAQAATAALETAQMEVSLALTDARDHSSGLLRMLDGMTERDALLVETRDLFRQQYLDLGTRTLLDLLDAERDLHQGRLERINTIEDIRKLRVDCLYNSGMARKAFSLSGQRILGISL